ncbi:NAD(P)-binding protein [Xylariaceae sp. FL0662B]|nr:NAD(P)-binding protein [Xylariaceae sp. FL0662B]
MTNNEGTIIVTGANGGLGVSIVSHIITSSDLSTCHGIHTVRDVARSTALGSALKDVPTSHSYETILLDLSHLVSVWQAAAHISSQVESGTIPPIRAVVLSAGYMEYYKQYKTDDGLDMSFVTNYLGHWLLILMVLQSMDREQGRIVVVGSFTYEFVLLQNLPSPNDKRNLIVPPGLKTIFRDSTEPIARGTWGPNHKEPSWRPGVRRYGASKLCQLKRRLDGDPVLNSISVLSVDPSVFPSGITRQNAWLIRVFYFRIIHPVWRGMMTWLGRNTHLCTREMAAQHVLSAAFASAVPLGSRPKGMYFDGQVPKEISVEGRDFRKQQMDLNDVYYCMISDALMTLLIRSSTFF